MSDDNAVYIENIRRALVAHEYEKLDQLLSDATYSFDKGMRAFHGLHNNKPETMLDMACDIWSFHGPECVRVLIKHGFRPDVHSFNQYNILINTIRHGHVKTLRLLLDKGLDVHARDADRDALVAARQARPPYTILSDAIWSRHHDIDVYVNMVGLLIDAGATERSDDLGVSFVESVMYARSKCRKAALAIMSMYNKCSITAKQDKNILCLISKHVWSTRIDHYLDSWQCVPSGKRCTIDEEDLDYDEYAEAMWPLTRF